MSGSTDGVKIRCEKNIKKYKKEFVRMKLCLYKNQKCVSKSMQA